MSSKTPLMANNQDHYVEAEDRFFDSAPIGLVVGLVVAASTFICLVGLIFAYRADKFRKGQANTSSSTEITEEKLVHGLILQHWNATDAAEDVTSQDTDGSSTNESGGVCALCSQPFEIGDLTTQSHNHNCHHRFHKMCIANWLHLQNSCPTCNQVYMVEQEEPQEHRQEV